MPTKIYENSVGFLKLIYAPAVKNKSHRHLLIMTDNWSNAAVEFYFPNPGHLFVPTPPGLWRQILCPRRFIILRILAASRDRYPPAFSASVLSGCESVGFDDA